MKKLSPFQLIFLVVAGIAIVAGVLTFALKQKSATQGAVPVTMWGTLDSVIINEMTKNILDRDRKSLSLTYTQFSEESFENELVEALAEGRGPDMVILPNTLIVKHQNKLFPIDFEFFNERRFKDTFIEEGELFTYEDGILAFPIRIDPLILYWNRTLFNNAGISEPPKFWDQLSAMVPSLTERDSSFNIFRSAIALGEFKNIDHAKEIFSTLLLQAGNPVIVRGDEGIDDFSVVLNSRFGFKIRPAEAAISFYTQFANPVREVYTWNRALPTSQEMFVAGELAMYIGFASEYDLIRQKNPNLNFDITLVPKSRSGSTDTYGEMFGIAITRNTPKVGNALDAIYKLIDVQTLKRMQEVTFLPPVRRDMLAKKPSDAVMSVFYNAALKSRGVLELDKLETEKIYTNMIESFISGRLSIGATVDKAGAEMRQLIK